MLESAIRRRALLLGIMTVMAAASVVVAGAGSPVDIAIGSSDLLGAVSAMPGPGGQEEPTWMEDEVLVRLKTFVGADEVGAQAAAEGFRSLNTSLGAKVLESIPVSDAAQVHRIKIPSTMSVEEAVIRYESSPFVEYAEPNYMWYPCATIPNDEFFLDLYNLHNTGDQQATGRWFRAPLADADIDAPEAWDIRTDASEVTVCVIDQGIQYFHPDLEDNMWVNEAELNGEPGVDDDGNGYIDDIYGWDFLYDTNQVYRSFQEDFHGTHVAGTIGARGNNEIGVAGIAWNVQIMSCKFIGQADGYTSGAIKAVNYAKMMGADITSNSWGGISYSRAHEEAIANSGMLFVASAGNSGIDNDISPHYPSSYDLPNVISVAATEWNDRLSNYSCYGARSVDIGAPGTQILSTVPDPDFPDQSRYTWFKGTSMATPHVSGAAALVVAQYPDMPQYPGAPGWTPGQETIKDILLKSGDPLVDLIGRTTSGRRLNIANALNRVYPPGIEYAGADATFGAPPFEVSFEARLEDPGEVAQCWWQFGEDRVYNTTATRIFVDEGSEVAWFYAQGTNGSMSKLPVQVTAAKPGTVVYVDDTGGFDDGTPLNALWMQAAATAGIPFVRVDATYPLGLSATAAANPVFWDTGATQYQILTPQEKELLASLMENGGRVFLAAPNYLTDLCPRVGDTFFPDWFGAEYLHMTHSVQMDVPIRVYKGIDADPITGGIELAPRVVTGLDDLVAPDIVSRAMLTGAGDSGDLPGALGIRHASSAYRMVYLSCPWSSLTYDSDPTNPSGTPYLLRKIYDYLTGDINTPPVIDKAESGLDFAKTGQVIEFAGHAHDPDGDRISYLWDFDDGTTAEGPIASHIYAEPGVYRSVLWVTDDRGETTGTELKVTVLNAECIVLVDDHYSDSWDAISAYWTRVMGAINKEFIELKPADVTGEGGAKAGLAQFRVIWTCALFGDLDDDEQAAVADLLDRGGRLVVSGPWIMSGLSTTGGREFARKYLHVADRKNDVGTTKVWGVEGDPITDGLEIPLHHIEEYDGTDALYLGPGAHPVFLTDSGRVCALRYEGEHRVMFLAFMLEAMSPDDPAGSELELSPVEKLIGDIIDWLGIAPDVEVVAPSAGGTWHGVNQVRWKATHVEDKPLTVALQYSLDGGSSWTTFASGLPNGELAPGRGYTGAYDWDVSRAPRSGPCMVKAIATDKYGTSGEGVSGQFQLINAGTNSFAAGPNPASSSMNFWVNASGDATLYIYDIAGRQVFSHRLEGGQCYHSWNLADKTGKPLANGLYLCYMVTDDGVKTDVMRLVISR